MTEREMIKELRDALAAAMRVMVHYGGADELFEIELRLLGIADGIGVRTDKWIAEQEAKK